MASGEDAISYGYDKNGSMERKTLSSRAHDRMTGSYVITLDQLSECTGYDGYRQQFIYDANGVRLSKSESGDAIRSTLEELLRGSGA